MKKQVWHPHEARRFAGYRAMQDVRSTRPDWQGVAGEFGMYLFSHAMWLAEEMRRGGFDRLLFLARDGRLVKEAFDAVNAVLRIPVATDYVRISRQAVLPLQLREPEELTSLPEMVQTAGHTPQTLAVLLSPALTEGEGLTGTRLLTAETLPGFIRACQACWDADKADAYREYARAYLAPLFTGKCAAFDVGYNLRSESVIREVTGADVTAFITHTDSDLPDRRGMPYRTLYPASPYVSWVAREQFLLTAGDAPCLRYGAEGPVLGDAQEVAQPMQETQRLAMAFVREMVRVHGENLQDLPFRPVDGCLPFERFLHCAARREMLPFRQVAVENGFHAGAAGEDSAFLQWRLMQTDWLAARGVPRSIVRLKRACIRLREAPPGLLKRLWPFASGFGRERASESCGEP